MSLAITILSLIAMVLVFGWFVASITTLYQWDEPDEGLIDLQTPPEKEGWLQKAEAIAKREHIDRADIRRFTGDQE